MRRWHSQKEENIMRRRWRIELGKHSWEYGQNYAYLYLAPPGDAEGVSCHCARGVGTMRKQRPAQHHKHCLLCNGSKYLFKGQRRREKYAAIQFELNMA